MSKSDVLLTELYPVMSESIKKNTPKFKVVLGHFIEKRSKELYDICPCDRIPFGAEDAEAYYNAMHINENMILNSLSKVYYWSMANFNPAAAKDPFTVSLLMIVRYFLKNKMQKELELACVYLAFSGKFYPSIHYGSYPKAQPSEYRHIMEYVVNNELSNKFDLKREGSVFGAIKSICLTWIDTYEDRFKTFEDEDIVYLIQQLHNRIKSFTKNIAEVYYKVYANKDSYIVYDSDNLSDDNYHLADNDSLKIEKAVERAMEYLTSNSVDYATCKMSSDSNVKTDEIKGIIEAILGDNTELGNIKELLRLIISIYFSESKTKDVRDFDFITKSITPKPNSKDKNVLRIKEIIESWLTENSPSYRKRRSREATKNSYHRSILSYFVIIISKANK